MVFMYFKCDNLNVIIYRRYFFNNITFIIVHYAFL
jgi:hypothetical protein